MVPFPCFETGHIYGLSELCISSANTLATLTSYAPEFCTFISDSIVALCASPEFSRLTYSLTELKRTYACKRCACALIAQGHFAYDVSSSELYAFR